MGMGIKITEMSAYHAIFKISKKGGKCYNLSEYMANMLNDKGPKKFNRRFTKNEIFDNISCIQIKSHDDSKWVRVEYGFDDDTIYLYSMEDIAKYDVIGSIVKDNDTYVCKMKKQTFYPYAKTEEFDVFITSCKITIFISDPFDPSNKIKLGEPIEFQIPNDDRICTITDQGDVLKFILEVPKLNSNLAKSIDELFDRKLSEMNLTISDDSIYQYMNINEIIFQGNRYPMDNVKLIKSPGGYILDQANDKFDKLKFRYDRVSLNGDNDSMSIRGTIDNSIRNPNRFRFKLSRVCEDPAYCELKAKPNYLSSVSLSALLSDYVQTLFNKTFDSQLLYRCLNAVNIKYLIDDKNIEFDSPITLVYNEMYNGYDLTYMEDNKPITFHFIEHSVLTSNGMSDPRYSDYIVFTFKLDIPKD